MTALEKDLAKEMGTEKAIFESIKSESPAMPYECGVIRSKTLPVTIHNKAHTFT